MTSTVKLLSLNTVDELKFNKTIIICSKSTMQPNALKSTTKLYGPTGKTSRNKQVHLFKFCLLPTSLAF